MTTERAKSTPVARGATLAVDSIMPRTEAIGPGRFDAGAMSGPGLIDCTPPER